MSEGRSLDRVARELGIPVSTVKKWCTRFDWRARLFEEGSEVRQAERDMEELRDKLLEYSSRLPIQDPMLPQYATATALLHTAIKAESAVIVSNGNGNHGR
jgi:transposase